MRADADGQFTWTPASALADGVHRVEAVVVDIAGNRSDPSDEFSLTVDSTAPDPAVIDGVSATASDSAGSIVNRLEDQVLRGSGEANATLGVYQDGVLLGETLVNQFGQWSFDMRYARNDDGSIDIETETPLASGSYNFTTRQTDEAGNTSAESSAFAVTVDTSPLAVLTSYDGSGTAPTTDDYAAAGLDDVSSGTVDELNSFLGSLETEDKDSADDIQAMVDAYNTLLATAAGENPEPALGESDFDALGISGVDNTNITAVVEVVRLSSDDGSDVSSPSALGAMVDSAESLAAGFYIRDYAEGDGIGTDEDDNDFTMDPPTLDQYLQVGVTGMDAGTDAENTQLLGAVNSALLTAPVNGAIASEKETLQAVIDAYTAILVHSTTDATGGPSADDYAVIGAELDVAVQSGDGFDLFDEAIGSAGKDAIDTVPEIEALASTAARVMETVNVGSADPALTAAELTDLGLTGVTEDNINAVVDAIAAKTSTSDVASLTDLQTVAGTGAQAHTDALAVIERYAEEDGSDPSDGNAFVTPSAADYRAAGVDLSTQTVPFDSSDFATALNTVLAAASVEGADVDTTAELTPMVETYATILAAADAGTALSLDETDYALLGLTDVAADANAATLLSNALP
ncbi:MAG: hypothetical protein FKY71_12400, partial [Spiribacter salinus]